MEPFATPDDIALWFENNRVGNFQIVASVAEVVVGFAGLYPLRNRQSHVGMVSLGVVPAAQGRGYGSLLLHSVLATADHLAGVVRVQLQVLSDNARAIALYRGFGFEIEGRHACFARRDGANGLDYVDALTMARIRHDLAASQS